MRASEIWWEQVGSSLRFTRAIVQCLKNGHSVVLQVPNGIPWHRALDEAVEAGSANFSAQKMIAHLQWTADQEPGAFVLNQLCPGPVQANYWPGQTYAEYLAGREDLEMNHYYIWVTGIHQKQDIAQWIQFVGQYERKARDLEHHGIFILEYEGEPVELSGVEKLNYGLGEMDCRVFCLELAMALQNTEVCNYQAELALSIGKGNPELCTALLHQGEDLLVDPVATTQGVLERFFTSEGKSFPAMSQEDIERAVRKAAVVLLFPILEQNRADFIGSHEMALHKALPIHNGNGEKITDPKDLEIGTMRHIVSTLRLDFTQQDLEQVDLWRDVRNLLAHNKIVPYIWVRRLLLGRPSLI